MTKGYINQLLEDKGLVLHSFAIDSVEELVDVYWNTRETNRALCKQMQELQEDCRKGLKSRIAETIRQEEYVPLEKLKGMTLLEIADLLEQS